MGFLQGLMGNANAVSVEEVKKEWGSLLAKDENIEAAYKLIRDYFIFTPKRLILIDVQGMTGKKVAVKSIPYRGIVAFSVETAGMLDLNAELHIWVASSPFAVKKTFNKDVNIYEVQAVLADAIAADNAANAEPAASPAAAGASIAEREAREPREAEKTEKRGEKAKPKEKKTGHIISLIIMLIIIVGGNVISLYYGELVYSVIVDSFVFFFYEIGMVFILAHLIAAINSIALCKRPKKEQTRVIALMSMFILIAGFDISRIACEFFPALIGSVFYGYQYGYQLDARDFAPLFIITLPIVVTAVIALCKRPKKEPARIIALVILVLTAGVHIFFIARFVLPRNFTLSDLSDFIEYFLPDVLVIITHFVAVINIIALCKRLKKNGV